MAGLNGSLENAAGWYSGFTTVCIEKSLSVIHSFLLYLLIGRLLIKSMSTIGFKVIVLRFRRVLRRVNSFCIVIGLDPLGFGMFLRSDFSNSGGWNFPCLYVY